MSWNTALKLDVSCFMFPSMNFDKLAVWWARSTGRPCFAALERESVASELPLQCLKLPAGCLPAAGRPFGQTSEESSLCLGLSEPVESTEVTLASEWAPDCFFVVFPQIWAWPGSWNRAAQRWGVPRGRAVLCMGECRVPGVFLSLCPFKNRKPSKNSELWPTN